MSIEKMIHRYNLYCRTHCLENAKYYKRAERRAAWLRRCAERQGVRLAVVTTLELHHCGYEYRIPLYGLKRRMILLDEEA